MAAPISARPAQTVSPPRGLPFAPPLHALTAQPSAKIEGQYRVSSRFLQLEAKLMSAVRRYAIRKVWVEGGCACYCGCVRQLGPACW